MTGPPPNSAIDPRTGAPGPAPGREACLAARIVAAPVLADGNAAAVRLREWLAALDDRAARIALENLFDASPHTRQLVDGLIEHSPYLWGLASADAARLAALLRDPPEQSLTRLFDHALTLCLETGDEAVVMRVLRRMKAEAALLVALCDIGGVWDLARVTGALSEIADAAVTGAVRWLLAAEARRGSYRPRNPEAPDEESGYIVLTMGKGGAGELNYSSDLDLIILFDPDIAPLAEGIEPQKFFVKITRGLVKLLQERTADGYVFRVDLRLRPDPGSTQIAISTDAAFHYYETRGQTWERAAMIKARASAGDRAAGERFLRDLKPFVWRRFLDYAAVADVHDMKRQMHAFRGHEEIAVEGHNVKLGRGGIREIEFFVQTQQLIAGGRHPNLRHRETLRMLSTLAASGWIAETARDELTDAYVFLRGVEHRLQMVADEQTHDLPDDPDLLEGFARFMGYAGRDAFAADLLHHLRLVQGHYGRLFIDAPTVESYRGALNFESRKDTADTLDTLLKLGFSDPPAVSATVRGWLTGKHRALRAEPVRQLLAELAPALVVEIAKSDDKDQSFATLDRFILGLPHPLRLLGRMRHSPDLVSLIARVIGTAPRVAEILQRRPQTIDALLEPTFFGALPTENDLSGILAAKLDESVGYEDFLDLVRAFAQEYRLLLAMRVLSGTVSAAQAGEGFARIADTVIRTLHTAVGAKFAERHGLMQGHETAVIALGKLGGREMTASSDLDLIIVYDHDAEQPESDGPAPLYGGHYFARFTQRLIAALTAQTNAGALYEVDMRLRPSGRSGPVATKINGFLSYQLEEAWTWEHMALTRARVVAASDPFRARIEEVIRTVLARKRKRPSLAADVHDMRRAIAGDKGEDDPWALKYAKGGLVDLEFTAQYLQLAHAATVPEILDPNTLRVFDKARRLGLVSPEDGEALRTACRLQHDLTQVLRLALPGGFEPKSAGRGLLTLLARAGDAPDFSALEARLFEVQANARSAFERIIGAR